jgi:branched-chain amino acid transport system substrate-binding protein
LPKLDRRTLQAREFDLSPEEPMRCNESQGKSCNIFRRVKRSCLAYIDFNAVALGSGMVFALASIPTNAGTGAEPIRIAWIDGLSGSFAAVGEWGLRHARIAAEEINEQGGLLGGRRIEIVPFDNKGIPQEALLNFKSVADQNIRYMFQGNGSGIALALSDAAAKHNARVPDQSVVFLNYAAGDPALTNEKCNFWHFRFDADAEMKMNAFTTFIAQSKEITKVYLINQDYSWGQAISRLAKRMLGEKRPDIRIVQDDFIPIGKVKDFAPYAAKIKASSADSILTGNWGSDLNLLIKAINEIKLPVRIFAIFGHEIGSPTVLGAAGAERVTQVSPWHANMGSPMAEQHVRQYWNKYRKKYNDDPYYSSIRVGFKMLAKAMNQVGSADPLMVAEAMEGMQLEDDAGLVWMRSDNHQLIQPLYISTFTRADGKNVKFDLESTGFGFRTDARIEAKDTELPTTCTMQRP